MIFNDPFTYKLIAKKYSNLMLDLYKKGKTKEQIRRIVAFREEAPTHGASEPMQYSPGDRVVVIGSNFITYECTIIEERDSSFDNDNYCSPSESVDPRYAITWEGKNFVITWWYIMGLVE